MMLSSVDGTLSVNGVSESVNDTSKQFRADWDIDDLAGKLDSVALLDETVITEVRDTDVVGLQVEKHSIDTRRELHHLLGCRGQSVGGIMLERMTTEGTLHALGPIYVAITAVGREGGKGDRWDAGSRAGPIAVSHQGAWCVPREKHHGRVFADFSSRRTKSHNQRHWCVVPHLIDIDCPSLPLVSTTSLGPPAHCHRDHPSDHCPRRIQSRAVF